MSSLYIFQTITLTFFTFNIFHGYLMILNFVKLNSFLSRYTNDIEKVWKKCCSRMILFLLFIDGILKCLLMDDSLVFSSHKIRVGGVPRYRSTPFLMLFIIVTTHHVSKGKLSV